MRPDERLKDEWGKPQDRLREKRIIRPATHLQEPLPYYDLKNNETACVFCEPGYSYTADSLSQITAKYGSPSIDVVYDSDRLSGMFGSQKNIQAREAAKKVDPTENTAAFYEAYLQELDPELKLVAIFVDHASGRFIKSFCCVNKQK